MPRLARPLNPAAVAAADDAVYAAHERDPRPNALFDAAGNKTPLSATDPSQEALRQEWTALYVKNGGKVEAPTPVGNTPPGDATEKCAEKHCNATITIGRVRRGNPYAPKDVTTGGMPDSVPPTKTYEVEVTVAWSKPSCPCQHIALSIINGSAANGTATISPTKITATTTVTITGGNQTAAGKAGNLKIEAKLDGAVKAESAGFSVCAHPIDFTDTFASDFDEPDLVGVVVQDGWSSDSGTFADLDQAEISEVVEYDAPTSPPYSGGRGARNSGYLAANALTTDTHTIRRPQAGPAATWERRQVSIFKCNRCGALDKEHPNSGLKIVHHVEDVGPPTRWVHYVNKFGAQVTARSFSSDAAAANVTSPQHALP